MLGAGLMMAAAIALLLALTWGGTRYPWLSPPILGLVGASVVLSLVFGWWLTRAPEPFLPLTVLDNPVMRIGTVGDRPARSACMTGLRSTCRCIIELVHKLTRDAIRSRAHSGRGDDDAGLDVGPAAR